MSEICMVCGGNVNPGSGQCEGCGHLPYGEVMGEATEAPVHTTVIPPAPVHQKPKDAAPKAGLPEVYETCARCNGRLSNTGQCNECGYENYPQQT